MEEETSRNNKRPAEALAKIAALCLFVLAGVFAYVKVWDTDVWWHLAAGRQIVEEQKIPKNDSFSFTASNKMWVNDEWFGDVYLYSMYKKSGIAGIQRLAAGISVLICFLLYSLALKLGADPLISIPAIAGALWAARVRLTSDRPEMFSILFTVAVFFLLHTLLTENKPDTIQSNRRRLFAAILIPVIQVVWSNVHPSSIFSLLLIIFAAIAGITAFAGDWKLNLKLSPEVTSRSVRTLGILLVAAAIASLLNPYGFHALKATFEFAKEKYFLNYIAEWAPIPISKYFTPEGAWPGRMGLPIFLVLGIASFAANGRKLNLFHVLVFAATAYMAFRSRRFIAVFCLLSAPVVAANLSAAFASIKERPVVRVAAAVAVITAIVALGWFDGIKGTRFPWGTGIKTGAYPEAAVNFIKENKFSNEMYNSYSLGGALIWGLYPVHRVFIDGRIPLYGGDFYRQYLRFEARPSVAEWNRIQNKYNINFAVLKLNQPDAMDAVNKSFGNWKTVFWDARVIIMAKTIPSQKELIEKYEYRITDPFSSVEKAYDWEKSDDGERNAIVGELERSLEESPENIIAIRALALIMLKDGKYERALDLAGRGLKINPGVAGLYAVRGAVLQLQGDLTSAKKAFDAADNLMQHGKTNGR
jgi:hypothetical protein